MFERLVLLVVTAWVLSGCASADPSDLPLFVQVAPGVFLGLLGILVLLVIIASIGGD